LVILAKIILIGDGAVGKTSLRNNFLGKSFDGEYMPTLGADFAIKNILMLQDKTHSIVLSTG
jgi:GTPase SAR1 family protein